MKKVYISLISLLLLLLCLTSCSVTGDKNTRLSIIYIVTVVLALIILIGYLSLTRQKQLWFIVLFSSVLVVNTGYFWLSISATLEQALMANRVSYLGSVLLPLSMLMIILNITGTVCKKKLLIALLILSFAVFLITASPGILDIYYREVSFAVVNGTSTLTKIYGPLHSMYLVYLLGYFSAMIVTILRASAQKQLATTAHAIILAIAVFVNIGVWYIEQLTAIEFEFLSISYIISELFLLGAHFIARENQRLSKLVNITQIEQNFTALESINTTTDFKCPDDSVSLSCERLEIFIDGLAYLTHTERVIYEAYLARATTKEIMTSLNISKNTLKFHNKNLYSKLGVSSRTELMEIYKQLTNMKDYI